MKSNSEIRPRIIEEEENYGNADFSDNCHPKVTAKKTFFDIHRNQRSGISGEEMASDKTIHPRIQWSAGTIDIGNHHHSGISDEYPGPRRETRIDDSKSTLTSSRRHLLPVPDTWGSIDAQPTQPEEILHIIAPSMVLPRTDISQDETRPRKKFFDKFRKRSVDAVSSKKIHPEASRESTLSKDTTDSVKPEEEFQRLNESYVRDGILSTEELPKVNSSTSKTVQTRFSFATAGSRLAKFSGSKVGSSGMKSPLNHDHDHRIQRTYLEERKGQQRDLGRDAKASGRTLSKEKRVTIAIDGKDCSKIEKPDANGSPLPARRSCEPMDVQNLRKLREPRPGPSTAESRDRDGPGNETREMVEESSRPHKMSFPESDAIDLEPLPSDSEDTLEEERGSPVDVDLFKIDNPFSDFSLQTIDRSKKLFRSETTKTFSNYLDPDQPGPSKGATMESYRQKVSNNRGKVTPGGSPEGSLSESEGSGLRITSFLDKAVMTDSPERTFDPVEGSRNNLVDQEKEAIGIDNFNGSWLICFVIQQILGDNVCWSHDPLKYDEKSVFDWQNHVLGHVLTPLMDSVVMPTFDYLKKNFLLNLIPDIDGKSYNRLPVSAGNSGFDAFRFLGSVCSKMVFDVWNVSQIFKNSICEGYFETLETNGFFCLLELLKSIDHTGNGSRFDSRSLFSNGQNHVISEHCNQLMEVTTSYVVDILFSPDVVEVPLILCLDSIPALILTPRLNFQNFPYDSLEFYCRIVNPRAISLGFVSTMIGRFFNLHRKDQGRESDLSDNEGIAT